MNTTKNVTSLAAFADEILDRLEKKTRVSGEEFIAFNESLPKQELDALRDLAHECHRAVDGVLSPRLPCDDVYRWIKIAAVHLSECSDVDDACESIREAGAGGWIYEDDAFAWLSRSTWNRMLFDEACNELGITGASLSEQAVAFVNYACVDACCRVAEALAEAADRGFGCGCHSDDYIQHDADSMAEEIGGCLEINDLFISSYCSEDVQQALECIDPEKQAEALCAALGDARSGGIFTTPSSVMLPRGEVEVQLDRHPAFVFTDLSTVTINENGFAYLACDSVVVDVDVSALKDFAGEE